MDIHREDSADVQDSNEIQINIVRRLQDGRGQLTIVGDDAQAIYGFRGATNQAFQTLQDSCQFDQPFVEHHLQQNYRSLPSIVAVRAAFSTTCLIRAFLELYISQYVNPADP